MNQSQQGWPQDPGPRGPAGGGYGPPPSGGYGPTGPTRPMVGPPPGGPAGPSPLVSRLRQGLLLLVASFLLKQLLLGLAVFEVGGLLSEPKLRARRSGELAEKRAELDEEYGEDWQFNRGGGEDKEKARKEWEEFQKEIADEYDPKLRDLRGAMDRTAASLMGKAQWYTWLKIFLDLLRSLGAALVILTAVGISADPRCGTWTKVYAVSCGSFAVLGVLFANIFTMLL
jgi:hypothetical protein